MGRTADKTDIPRRLTEAGYLLFNRDGYNATGIQQIADQAGVPKGSFYNHFDSKEAFAAAIIKHYADWVSCAWDQCLDQAPAEPVAALRHLFGCFAKHHESQGCQGCLVGNFAAEVAESSPLCRDVLQSCLSDWRGRLAHLIAQAQASGALRSDVSAPELATFFWDAWEGALLRMKVEQRVQPLHDTLALLLDHLLRPQA